jgi:hypothetical protein
MASAAAEPTSYMTAASYMTRGAWVPSVERRGPVQPRCTLARA